MVERVQDADAGVQKLAIETLGNEIRCRAVAVNKEEGGLGRAYGCSQ